MARPARLELATLCLEGRRSIQLSYGRYADSKRFRVSTNILISRFTVILKQEVTVPGGNCAQTSDPYIAALTSKVSTSMMHYPDL
jgi:hypothetical protein